QHHRSRAGSHGDPVREPGRAHQDGNHDEQRKNGQDHLADLGIDEEVHAQLRRCVPGTGEGRDRDDRGPRPVLSPTDHGQEDSIWSSTSSVSAPSVQSTMPLQKEPAPTSEGIMSEPSKRATALSSCNRSIDRRSTSEEASDGSTAVFAEVTPPISTRVLAHSPEAMKACTAAVASSSLNAPTNSPATSSGLSSALTPGR